MTAGSVGSRKDRRRPSASLGASENGARLDLDQFERPGTKRNKVVAPGESDPSLGIKASELQAKANSDRNKPEQEPLVDSCMRREPVVVGHDGNGLPVAVAQIALKLEIYRGHRKSRCSANQIQGSQVSERVDLFLDPYGSRKKGRLVLP
jgi:hypothetical protein